jgi:hypothetical protein
MGQPPKAPQLAVSRPSLNGNNIIPAPDFGRRVYCRDGVTRAAQRESFTFPINGVESAAFFKFETGREGGRD